MKRNYLMLLVLLLGHVYQMHAGGFFGGTTTEKKLETELASLKSLNAQDQKKLVAGIEKVAKSITQLEDEVQNTTRKARVVKQLPELLEIIQDLDDVFNNKLNEVEREETLSVVVRTVPDIFSKLKNYIIAEIISKNLSETAQILSQDHLYESVVQNALEDFNKYLYYFVTKDTDIQHLEEIKDAINKIKTSFDNAMNKIPNMRELIIDAKENYIAQLEAKTNEFLESYYRNLFLKTLLELKKEEKKSFNEIAKNEELLKLLEKLASLHIDKELVEGDEDLKYKASQLEKNLQGIKGNQYSWTKFEGWLGRGGKMSTSIDTILKSLDRALGTVSLVQGLEELKTKCEALETLLSAVQ